MNLKLIKKKIPDVIISTARSMSAVTLPLLTATASASLSPTSTFTLLRTPAVLHTSTADILPTIFPQPFSYTNIFSTSDTTSNYPATSNTVEASSSPTTPSTLLPPIMVSHAKSWLNHTVPMHTASVRLLGPQTIRTVSYFHLEKTMLAV